jgi:hypothetical protein
MSPLLIKHEGAKAMSNTPITEEVKKFVRQWFRKLDVHPHVEEMLPWVADEKLVMKMPDREEPFYRHEGFKEWYQGAEKFFDQVHTIKGLKITHTQDTAKVEVILQWQRSVSAAPDAERERLGFFVAQTWELERSPQTQEFLIVTYKIDYYLSEVDSAYSS